MIIYEYSDDSVVFVQLHLGGDRNFCYLLGDRQSGTGAAVDPGFGADQLAKAAAEHTLEIKKILITHAHSDHIGEADKLAKLTKATIHAGKKEKVQNALDVSDGDRLALGQRIIFAYQTPGHSPGHLCYLFEKRLLTGDLLFCGKVGGTGSYFPDSSAEAEWASLQRIMNIPDDVEVFPGHDYYGGEGDMSHSTIGYEKEHNPFLKCKSFEDFRYLKDHWESYKAKHGIR
jgi:hydroxyacylglutathione hydrolase